MLNQKQKKNKNYQVYLLECSDGTYYTGVSNDIPNRLHVHSKGKGSKYVAGRLPFVLIAISRLMNKSDAYKFERLVKDLPRIKKPQAVRSLGRIK